MADGKTHAGDSVMLAVPVAVTVSMWQNLPVGLLAGAGCVLGVVLSPDLDQQSWTYSEWVWNKFPLIGWLLAWLFFIYWWPYGVAFRHGHWLTHVPVVSTAIRMIYALFPITLLILVDMQAVLHIFPLLEQWLPYIFLGLCVADTAHWARDGFRLWGI